MATTFNNSNLNGICQCGKLNFVPLDQSGSVAEIEITVSESKDPVFMVIDLRESFYSIRVNLLDAEGNVVNRSNEMDNGFHVYSTNTFGCVDKNGVLRLQLEATNGSFSPDLKIGIGSFSHVPVVNH